MTNPDDVFAHIQQLAEQHADIVAVWLYGSRAQGRARQDSDYDLAIAFNDFSLDALARYVRHIVWRWIGLRAGAHFSSIE